MSKLISIFRAPLKMKLYFLKNLPSVYFWGIKVKEINSSSAKIMIPYSWRTQNPFKSIYFSALAGAAELSTGLLAFLAIEKENVSMLVIGVNGRFIKKANTLVNFVCEQGEEIKSCVEKAVNTGEGQELKVVSKGYNVEGEIIAEFEFLWSFKKRK